MRQPAHRYAAASQEPRPSAPMMPNPHWQRRPWTLVVLMLVFGWFGLLLLDAVRLPANVQTLGGSWPAIIEEPGEAPYRRNVYLPGRFGVQSLDPESRVQAVRTVRLPAHQQPWALHIESPRFAMVVRWDGVEIARHGTCLLYTSPSPRDS